MTEARSATPTDPDSREDAPEPVSHKLGRAVLTAVLAPFVEIGAIGRLLGEAVFWGIRPPYRMRNIIEQMEFIGVGSLFIVGLTAAFIGMVMGLQMVTGFREFGAESQTGGVVAMGLTRELGPVFSALMVSSRAGSAMTTELGSMRVSSQIDALTTMAVNPVQYLVVPRLIAGFVMVPALTMLFIVVGMTGSYAVGVGLMGLDPGIFMDRAQWLVDGEDVAQGMIKAAVFGFAICLIACRQGFFASGGAAGVGRATNRSVVQNAVAVLALDYMITSIILGGQGGPF